MTDIWPLSRKAPVTLLVILCLTACAWAQGVTTRPATKPATLPVKPPATQPTQPSQDEAAEALKAFNTLFGQKMRGVAATGSLADDAALAGDLMKVAKKAKESPALAAIICEKAHWLGAKHVTGYDVAIEALHLLSETKPEIRAECLDKILLLRQRQYQQAKGTQRGVVGRKLVKQLMAAADCQAEAKEYTKALGFCHRVLPIARIHEPDAVTNIQKNVAEYARLSGLERFIGALKSRLTANKNDQAARDQIIRLYVTERDNPAEAVKYLNSSVPADFAANVPLAAKQMDGLDELASMKLGTWYEGLAKTPSKTAKIVTLLRAHKYYDRFLSVHEKKDMAYVKAAMSLAKVKKDLAVLGIKPPEKMKIPWKKVFAFATQASYLSTMGSSSLKYVTTAHLLKGFDTRTIELWMLPSKHDGIIFDLGSDESGIAMAIVEGQLNMVVRSWVYYSYRKRMPSKTRGVPGEIKIITTKKKIFHGAFLKTLLPSRKNWSHLAVVIDRNRVSLWVNGEMKGRSTMAKVGIQVPYKSVMAIGAGYNTNTGRWPTKGFGGNIALLKVSGAALYSKTFTPPAKPSATGALAYLQPDALSTGKISKYGFKAGGLSWIPQGGVNVASAAIVSGVPLEPVDPGKTAPGLMYRLYDGKFRYCTEIASKGTRLKSGYTSDIGLGTVALDQKRFGLLFYGFIEVPKTGKYVFHVLSDDGSRLYIGSALVVNNDGVHVAQTKSGGIALKAGKHSIALQYFRYGTTKVLAVAWEGPGITKQKIPATAFSRKVYIPKVPISKPPTAKPSKPKPKPLIRKPGIRKPGIRKPIAPKRSGG